MKRSIKGICLIALSLIMVFAMFGCEPNTGKKIVNDASNRETVIYGTYAQNLVSDEATVEALKAAQWSGNRTRLGENEYERVVAAPYRKNAKFEDGTVITEGETYYFTVTPIKWYVLKSGDNSTLLSQKILDIYVYQTNTETDNEGNYPNNWSLSTLRNWLNGSFYSSAFTAIEGASINNTKVISKYPQSYYKAHSGAIADSWDKVYCLSYAEAVSSEYSFTTEKTDYDGLRMAKVTDYARAKGAWFYVANANEGTEDYERELAFAGNGNYWLRTVGQDIIYAGIARYTGEVGKIHSYVAKEDVGVRPVISVGFEL